MSSRVYRRLLLLLLLCPCCASPTRSPCSSARGPPRPALPGASASLCASARRLVAAAAAATQAELTAGIFNTAERDGYLPLLTVLARHGCGVCLTCAELRSAEQPAHALADPEQLLRQVRAGAAALHLPLTLGNRDVSFAPGAFAALAQSALQPAVYRGIELPPADSVVFERLCDCMFEQGNWQAFKTWAAGIHSNEGADEASASVSAAPAAAAPASAPLPRPDSPSGWAAGGRTTAAEGFSASEDTLTDRLQPVAQRLSEVQQQQQQPSDPAAGPGPGPGPQQQQPTGAQQAATAPALV